MPRSGPNPTDPGELLASINALAEQTYRLTMGVATDAARAFDDRRESAAVDHVCRLAVGAGISAGEMAWLAGELQAADPDPEHRAAAIVAITCMRDATTSAAGVVQTLADEAGTPEISASAEALRRVAAQLMLLPDLLDSAT